MIAILLKSLMAIATKALVALGSKALLEWALFYLLEKFVESTKTKSDDKLLIEFRKAFDKAENDG